MNLISRLFFKPNFGKNSFMTLIKNLYSNGVMYWGDDDEEEQPSYAQTYAKAKDPRIDEYMNLLDQRAKGYLAPGYEALTPSQQNLIYGRIKEQLMPDIERGLKGQMQDITNMGIEGTPGSAILGKLRQDYLKDLSGRATDVAIKGLDLTRSDIGRGEDILSNLRSSLLGESQNIANQEYGGNMAKYSYDQNANSNMSSSLGTLAGILGASLIPVTGGLSGSLALMGLGGAAGGALGSSDSLKNILGMETKKSPTYGSKYNYYSQLN